MAGIGCFHKDTELIGDIQNIMRILAGNAIQNDRQFTLGEAYKYMKDNDIEVDLESVAAMYEDVFDLNDGNFSSQDEVDTMAGRSFNNTLDNLVAMQPKLKVEKTGDVSPGKQVAKIVAGIFRNANVTDIKTQTTMKMFEKALERAARNIIDKSALPDKAAIAKKSFEDIIATAFDLDTHGTRTLSGTINSARDVYNEFQKETDKYRKELKNKGADEATIEQFENFTQAIIDKGYNLLLSQQESKDVVNGALIDAGFFREATINGTKQKILDWRKLTDAAGSPTYLQQNVTKVFQDLGYSQSEIDRINDALENQYVELRAKIIDNKNKELQRQQDAASKKPLKELNRRNKIIAHQQTVNAKRLAQLYTYGLFDAVPGTYENVLNSVFGMSDIDQQTFNKLKVFGKSLQTLYSTKINDTQLSEHFFKSAVNEINEQIGELLRKNQNNNSKLLKVVRTVQSLIDASMRFLLTGLKNMAVQNPLSGYAARLTASIQDEIQGNMTPALRAQNRKLMRDVFKDMALNGGLHFGDVNTTFINRGRLDEIVNNLSDNQMYHAIVGTVIGRTGLDAMDSRFKSNITQKYVMHNLIKILMSDRKTDEVKDGKPVILKAMTKLESQKYISKNVLGKSYEDAEKMATGIISQINKDAGKKVLDPSPYFVTRLANDIVQGQLVADGAITEDQVLAAYESAYKAAGRDLGHVPNNILSEMVNNVSNSIQKKIDDAVKRKEYNKASMLTARQIFARNFANPFVGGATNWIVLKLEKSGVGIITGLLDVRANRKIKIDLTTDAGMRDLTNKLYDQQKAWNKVYRGAVGAVSSAIMYGVVWAALKAAFSGSGDDDKERRKAFYKWRMANRWASKYLDEFTPEWLLGQMYIENNKLKDYVDNYMGWNDSYSAISNLRSALGYYDKGNMQRFKGEIGEAIGTKANAPVPGWRPVNDLIELYQGATGQLKPYQYMPSNNMAQGILKNGFLEKTGIIDAKEMNKNK